MGYSAGFGLERAAPMADAANLPMQIVRDHGRVRHDRAEKFPMVVRLMVIFGTSGLLWAGIGHVAGVI